MGLPLRPANMKLFITFLCSTLVLSMSTDELEVEDAAMRLESSCPFENYDIQEDADPSECKLMKGFWLDSWQDCGSIYINGITRCKLYEDETWDESQAKFAGMRGCTA